MSTDIDDIKKILNVSLWADEFLNHCKRFIESDHYINVIADEYRNNIPEEDQITLDEKTAGTQVRVSEHEKNIDEQRKQADNPENTPEQFQRLKQLLIRMQRSYANVSSQLEHLKSNQSDATDYDLMFAAYHYAGATCNRTPFGFFAKNAIANYDNKLEINNETTTALLELVIIINKCAACRERMLQKTSRTLMMGQRDEISLGLKTMSFYGKQPEESTLVYLNKYLPQVQITLKNMVNFIALIKKLKNKEVDEIADDLFACYETATREAHELEVFTWSERRPSL